VRQHHQRDSIMKYFVLTRFLSPLIILISVVIGSSLVPISASAEGSAWEPFLAFPPSASGRTDGVAIFHQGTLYVLGGEPYRCPDADPCNDPEIGAADYLTPGDTHWSQGQGFDSQLQRLGGGNVSGFSGPIAFGGSQGDDPIASDQTFFYDSILGDQTEPSLGRRNFMHSHFAWATDGRGRLYSIGGGPGESASAQNPNTSDVERYDASSDTWTIITSLPQARANAAAVYDGQDHILVFGGYDEQSTRRFSDVLSYDITNDIWSTLGPLPTPAQGNNEFSDQRALLGANGIVYIVGGINGPMGGGTTRAHVYTWEPVTATWGTAPDLLTARHSMGLALDDTGWMYALGGRDGTTGLSTNERFDTSPVGSECITAAACDDELACNGAEFCVDGSCLSGNPVECGFDEICITGGSCRVQRFDIIDLSESLGSVSVNANGIDNDGRVVGEYFDTVDSQWHGFLYDGSIGDLGTGRARAVSDDGWIVGDDSTAFALDPGGVRTDLGTLGGVGSVAYGVTIAGSVVGQSDVVTGADRAFLVRNPGAVMEDLGTLGDYSIAHGINPNGLVVGESLVTDFDPHAEPFVFDSSVPGAVMQVMPGAYSAGSARGVNDQGHITGWISNDVDSWGDAFVFDGLEAIKLGDITGKAYSIGTAINNSDQVVGYAFGEWIDTVCCGVIWSNGILRAYFYDGVAPVNLNDELPESSGWILTIATGINDSGAIVGSGTKDGAGHAFLLAPHSVEQDVDADGVPDDKDNCPTHPNTAQENSDSDSFGDACDNCTLVDNEDQRDTDADLYGNICDGDFDQNEIVNYSDFRLFRRTIGTSDPDADFDDNGIVDRPDLVHFRSLMRKPPGPSGLVP
jgi:probable HAF family extracellular repeat protein